MSWERKLWDEEQKTQALLEELSYSEDQRRADELFLGDDALDEEWASHGRQASPVGWALGSPYHRRLGGHVHAYLWFIGLCLAIGLIAFGVRAYVDFANRRQQQQFIQQVANPHGPSSPGQAPSPAGP